MPLPIPNLDDWSFQELVDEGVRLIPPYAPEWTDFNASDPGITVLELLAYVTEQLIFQTAQITAADLGAFLTLLSGEAARDTGDEDQQDALLACIRELRQPGRAVSCADFELGAPLADPRGARASCVPRSDLAQRGEAAQEAARPGHVSVIILPTPATDEARVEELLVSVHAFLEQRRTLTTRLHLVQARRVACRVKLKVVLAPSAHARDVVANVRQSLQHFLDPLSGGHDGLGWPFGRAIFVSDLYQLVANLPEVEYVCRDLDPLTGRETEELFAVEAGPDRMLRNAMGELIALVLARDELPGELEVVISAESTPLGQSRQL